jgi:putative spermidine/putrescine transport system permease protein
MTRHRAGSPEPGSPAAAQGPGGPGAMTRHPAGSPEPGSPAAAQGPGSPGAMTRHPAGSPEPGSPAAAQGPDGPATMTRHSRLARRRQAWSAGDLAGAAVLVALAGLALVVLLAPMLVVVLISFDAREYIGFPPERFSLRWYRALAGHAQILDAARVSLRVALDVTLACLALGVPAAYALVRGTFPGRTAVEAFLLAPQMMPGLVIGVAVLFFGAYFAFRASHPMLVLSLTVFCLPFVVRVVMARLAGLDPALEEASATLGAGRLETFLRVTLPQTLGAVLGAAAVVFIEAFDNVTVALFTASPRARPLAVELYYLVQYDSSPLVAAVSAFEILLAVVVVAIAARTISLERIGR